VAQHGGGRNAETTALAAALGVLLSRTDRRRTLAAACGAAVVSVPPSRSGPFGEQRETIAALHAAVSRVRSIGR
jgi:hypothetical protein